MPKVQIFDPAAARAETARLDNDVDDDFSHLGAGQHDRLALLRRLADDPRGGLRDELIADRDSAAKIAALTRDCSHFSSLIDLFKRAAVVSLATATPLRPPPVLLVGPPGVGKSYVARRLAGALNVPVVERNMVNLDDSGVMTGFSPTFRAARMGAIARVLIDADVAAPVVVLDEIDKAARSDRGDPLDFLHELLDPQNSSTFRDAFIDLPMRADRIVWIFAANEIGPIRSSLLDRMLVLEIAAPDADASRNVLNSLMRAATARYHGNIDGVLGEAVVGALAGCSPRRMAQLIDLAIGYAISEGRRRLALEDVLRAQALLERPSKPAIGFLPAR